MRFLRVIFFSVLGANLFPWNQIYETKSTSKYDQIHEFCFVPQDHHGLNKAKSVWIGRRGLLTVPLSEKESLFFIKPFHEGWMILIPQMT